MARIPLTRRSDLLTARSLRELLIFEAAFRESSPCEWHRHAPIAHGAGLAEAKAAAPVEPDRADYKELSGDDGRLVLKRPPRPLEYRPRPRLSR